MRERAGTERRELGCSVHDSDCRGEEGGRRVSFQTRGRGDAKRKERRTKIDDGISEELEPLELGVVRAVDGLTKPSEESAHEG